MYQLQAGPNISQLSTPSTGTVENSPIFSPPSYAIWANSLWFLSLVISLSCNFMCYAGDVVAAVGTSIPHGQSTSGTQCTRAGAEACVFYEWHRQISCSPSGPSRSTARPDTCFPICPFSGPPHLSIQYQSHRVQRSDVLGCTFVGGICQWVDHVYANVLAGQPILFATPPSLVLLHSNFLCCPE